MGSHIGAVLSRSLSVEWDAVELPDALEEISEESSVHIGLEAHAAADLRGRTITLRARNVVLEGVLIYILDQVSPRDGEHVWTQNGESIVLRRVADACDPR